jgi:plastocyanin
VTTICPRERTRRHRRWRRALAGVVLLAAGCNKSSGPPKKVVATPVDPATAGHIEVQVMYDGSVPPPKALDMRSAAQCAAAHAEPVYDQSLLVQDGHLANAVVWIKEGLQGWVFAPPDQPVVIDQQGCVYVPHVAAAMVGQPVEFRNSDREAHNVHGHPKVVPAWNFLLSRPGASQTLSFDKPEVAIPIGCDIHPWMRAYLAILDNPYFAVSPSSGVVRLAQVPPGRYVLAAWHEKLGTKEQPVTLEARGAATVQFRFAASG